MTLPDMIAVGSSRPDWMIVSAAVDRLGLDSTGIRAFSTSQGDLPPVRLALSPQLTVNLFDFDEVLGDVELRQLSSQADVDRVCGFARAVGVALHRDVVFVPEGEPTLVGVRFVVAKDTFAVEAG